MLNIYLVRHGQTEWNIERRFQGWLDSPLTKQGVECAQLLKEKIAPIKFDRFITSPSNRAVKTMELILPAEDKCFDLDDRLREINLGPWQGMTHEAIEALYPEQLKMFYMNPEAFNLQHAETYFDVYDRIRKFIDELVSRHETGIKSSNILIVTHGIALMIFQLIFDGLSLSELPRYSVSNNATLHHYCYNEGMFSRQIEGAY
ncbi:MAG TPA: histidine phosphatase family protein [Clostridiales bacterium UBA8960]|jgi:probable phosphoglycerate mutase|nr:histidine phosphatase family protein [Clostridiales bacterium UBA8960]